jgi:hypothetical protein
METLLANISKKHQESSSSCAPAVPRDLEDLENEFNSYNDDEEGEAELEETPYISCPTFFTKTSAEEDEYNEIQEKLKNLTISDYQRTRYIGASSGVHFLNEEIFRTNKKHRLPEEPSWFIQKLNHDEDEHIIMKTKEVITPTATNRMNKELELNRIEIFEDTPYMTQELADYLVHM